MIAALETCRLVHLRFGQAAQRVDCVLHAGGIALIWGAVIGGLTLFAGVIGTLMYLHHRRGR